MTLEMKVYAPRFAAKVYPHICGANLPTLLWKTSRFALKSTLEEFLVLEVQWSSRTYGPDGPWRAVTVYVGNPPQSIDLIPGIYYSSTVFFTAAACNGADSPSCSANSIYNPGLSNTAVTDLVRNGTNSWASPMPMGGSYFDVADDILIPFTNHSQNYAVRTTGISITDGATVSYPKGDFAVTVGALCLGAGLDPWDFPQTDSSTKFTAAVIPNYFADNDQNKTIATGSYGLHLGSTEPDIPPSFTYGGYDTARVIGSFATGQLQDDSTSWANITDISIGALGPVEAEYNATTPGGVIADGLQSSFPTALIAQINPGQPYLALPKAICDSLTSKLPVSFSNDLGLYIWNTSDPRYPFIIQSPQYLNISILSSDGSTVSIAVPFMLLNLTRTPPLVDTPTLYFPCFTAFDPHQGYSLGRAFLQSAFFVENWRPIKGPGSWFLAQAPGPGFGQSAPKVMYVQDSAIQGVNQTWADKWDGHWNNATVLRYWQQKLGGLQTGISGNGSTLSPPNQPSSSLSSSNTPGSSPSSPFVPSSKSGLDASAKIGIAAAVVAGVIAGVIGVAGINYAKKRRTRLRQGPKDREYKSEPVTVLSSNEIYEAGGRVVPAELDNATRAELEDSTRYEFVCELDGTTALQELPSTPIGFNGVRSNGESARRG
ncbi:MAG: hypothetical protein M1820_010499 [Bogoriella megaspora]|nr:MAG: hypothetical protein M1820_010499 [Bogoriella megaspora]